MARVLRAPPELAAGFSFGAFKAARGSLTRLVSRRLERLDARAELGGELDPRARRERVVGREVLPKLRPAVIGECVRCREDRLRRLPGAAVLVAADAARLRRPLAELEVGVRAPARRTV